MTASVFLTVLTLCLSCPVARAQTAGAKLTSNEFRELMEKLEAAWNSNDAKTAADCFSEDAVYSAPPDGPVRRGREALFAFFGGSKGRPHSMKMEWHHLLFDEQEQVGAGEYTFTYDIRTHGMVIVRIRKGRIANWREYERESPSDWQAFVGSNQF
jgi:ketosteroid isomerase-like protein